MKRLQKLGADRLRVIRTLVEGSRIEKRRCHPFEASYRLIRIDSNDLPPNVSEFVVSELIAMRLIAPSTPVDFSIPNAADAIDYVATPAAARAVQLKGVEYEDMQLDFVPPKAVRYHNTEAV